MNLLTPKIRPASKTLRVLARLLSYPDATLRRYLPEMRAALQIEDALSSQRMTEINDLMAWMGGDTGLGDAGAFRHLEVDQQLRTVLRAYELAP